MACHLSIAERDQIAQMRHQGATIREVAAKLNRSPSTVSRELKRNSSEWGYGPGRADQIARQRRSQRPFLHKMDRPELNDYVREGLANYWSPEEIAGRLATEAPLGSEETVCAQTIYAWIDSREPEEQQHWRGFLRRRGKRSRPKPENPGEFRSTIADRPAVVESRGRLGDFEGDTVLGKPGTGGIVTLVDRRSRWTLITKIKHKEAPYVKRKIADRFATLDADQRHSLTFDNGTEFAHCPQLEDRLNIKVYFARPGCPQQRGTNENTNGLIRQFFPKRTEFQTVSHQQVHAAETLLNNRPRKCLGYKTPNEVFFGKRIPTRCV